MITANIIVFGMVIPFLIAGIMFVIAWRPWKPYGHLKQALILGPSAIGLGYLAGHSGLDGFPPIPPVTSLQWLMLIVFAVWILSTLESMFKTNKFYDWVIRIMVSFAMPWILLRSMFQYSWSMTEGFFWLTVVGFITLGFWKLMDSLTRGFTGYSAPLFLLLITVGMCGALVITGSALLGHLGGLVAAGLTAGLLIAFFVPYFSLAHGAVSIITVILSGLLLNGYFYSELPVTSIIPLLLTPAAPWLAKLSVFKKWGILWINVIAAVCIAILAAVAIVFAIQSSPPLDYGY